MIPYNFGGDASIPVKSEPLGDNAFHRHGVTLRQLAILESVFNEGSAGAAARALGLSQPAVSHALAKLEAELGTVLLHRSQAGCAPTDAGGILQRRASRLFEQIKTGLSGILADRPDSHAIRQRAAALTSTQAACHLAIADQGSFRDAARLLAISEPAVQRTARGLERLLGVALYQRQGRVTKILPSGERLATAVQLALAEIDQARDEITAASGQSAGRIALGCLPLMPKSIIATALSALLARYPTVRVSLEEGPYDRLSLALSRGRLDMLLGAVRNDGEQTGFAAQILFDDPYVVVARDSHPLVGRRRPTMAALSRQNWVAPPHGTPRRAVLEQLFALLPRRPAIALETASVSTMMATLSKSDCLCLTSRIQARSDFASADLVILPFPIVQAPRPVGITTRATWLPTTVQCYFLGLISGAKEGGSPS